MQTLLSIKSTALNALFLVVFAMLFYGSYQFYLTQEAWNIAVNQLQYIEEGYDEWVNWSTAKSKTTFTLTDFVDVKHAYEKRLNYDLNVLKEYVPSKNQQVADLAFSLSQALEAYETMLKEQSVQHQSFKEIQQQIIDLRKRDAATFSTNYYTVAQSETAFFLNPNLDQSAALYSVYDLLFKLNTTSANFTPRQTLLETLNNHQKILLAVLEQEHAFSLADIGFRQSLSMAKQEFSAQLIQQKQLFFALLAVIVITLYLGIYWIIRYTQRHYYEPIASMTQSLIDAEKGQDTAEVAPLKAWIIPEELSVLAENLNKLIDKLNIQRTALSFLSLEDNSSSSKVGFIAAAAREIRTPLNTLTNTINQLLDSDAMQSEWADEIKELHHASFQLLTLINQVVDINKLQEGTLRLVIKPSSLLEQIHTICAIFKDKFSGKGVEFRLIMDESSLPEIVETDAVRLNQILLSILQQAWRKTNRGSVTLQITKTKQLTDECSIRFEITDTGEGYEEDEVAIIKDNTTPIFEVDNRLTGLLLCKALLNYFNSTISIDTEPELGTSIAFTMNFPILHSLHVQKNPVLLTKMVNQVAAAEKRILIVDDNAVNLKITARILQKDMYHCELATNAAEAIEAIAKGKVYDLILMDLDMPDMDGISCTEYIRQSNYSLAKTVPIVALTAASSDTIKEKAFMRGMNDFITKPFTPLELLRVVAKNIDLAKQFGHTA